jgi:hypothetical protein
MGLMLDNRLIIGGLPDARREVRVHLNWQEMLGAVWHVLLGPGLILAAILADVFL